MDRRLLAAVAVVLLVGLAGCTTIFGSDAGDTEHLSQDAEYDFDTDREAYVVVNRDNYTAVYDVSAKRSDDDTIQLYETDALSLEEPLDLYGLQFRYPNGTIVRYVDGESTRVYPDGRTERVDALAVSADRQRTTVELPAEEGKLAFTTPKSGKRVAVQTPVVGTYEVVLPPNTDASIPLLAQVRPSNDDREVHGDRVHLIWEDLDASVLVVRWYLDRDVWLFGGLTALSVSVGVAGSIYYYIQIREARRRREEEGIDVDYDDREGPPPGMG